MPERCSVGCFFSCRRREGQGTESTQSRFPPVMLEGWDVAASPSCRGAALDLGSWVFWFFFFAGKPGAVEGEKHPIQPVPGWFGVFGVPPEGCQPHSQVLWGGPQLLVLCTAGTCEVLTHLLIA